MGVSRVSATGQPPATSLLLKDASILNQIIEAIAELVKKILCPIRVKQMIAVLDSSAGPHDKTVKIAEIRKKLPTEIEEAYLVAVRTFEGTPTERLSQVRKYFVAKLEEK